MLACARLGAVHSVVFGGFAPHELAARIDDAQPKVVVVGVAAASSRAGSSSTSRCSTRRSSSPQHQPERVRRPAAAAGARRRWASATSTGTTAMDGRTPTRAGRLRRGRGHRPALHPLHLRHDRASRRASCATTAATRSRCAGRWRTSTTSARARCGGPPPTSAGSSATPTSSTRRCSPARRRCSTRASRSARPTPARSGGSSREHGVKALFTAPTAYPGDQEGGPDGASCWPATTCRRCARCSSPASGSTRTPTPGPTERLGVPVVDHWWQTETGWPIAANLRGLEPMPIKAGLADGAGARLRRAGPRRARRAGAAGHGGRDLHPAAAAARARCRRCGATTSGTSPSYLSAYRRLLPHRRRRLRRRGRLPLRDGPHRRRHQRRRPPALDRLDGGGPRRRTRPSPSAR